MGGENKEATSARGCALVHWKKNLLHSKKKTERRPKTRRGTLGKLKKGKRDQQSKAGHLIHLRKRKNGEKTR